MDDQRPTTDDRRRSMDDGSIRLPSSVFPPEQANRMYECLRCAVVADRGDRQHGDLVGGLGEVAGGVDRRLVVYLYTNNALPAEIQQEGRCLFAR